MDRRNETASRYCCFLSEEYFDQLYDTFIEAFSDYVFPFALTVTQFRNHINLNAVDLERTVGCFEDGRLVGFSLNGFGEWGERPTLYDAGTGVIPSARRRGVSRAMFDHMLPRFKAEGIEQCVLEVVKTNVGAIHLYQSLDFTSVRELALLQCDTPVVLKVAEPPGIDVREIDQPDWSVFRSFRDGKPSWQNSNDAIRRSTNVKQILGAFDGDVCVGYVIFSAQFGRIAQLAVHPAYRRRGIGSLLLQRMRAATADGHSLQVINLDKELEGAMKFFEKHGFYERLIQYEMLKLM